MDLNIKTFIRIDANIIRMIVDARGRMQRYLGTGAKEHWAIVKISPISVTAEVKDFLRNNPLSFCYMKNIVESQIYSEWEIGTEENDLFIGISLSTLTKDMVNLLQDVKGVRCQFHTNYMKEIVPGLFLNGKTQFAIKDPEFEKLQINQVVIDNTHTPEKEFRSWVEKLDLFYEYSDSLAVYKAGKLKEEQTIEKGIRELGLSKVVCKNIISKVYQEQQA